MVLSGFGQKNPDLICKPGMNEFPDCDSIDHYVDGNKAAQGFFDSGDLELVKSKAAEKPTRTEEEEKANAIRLAKGAVTRAKNTHDKCADDQKANAKRILAEKEATLKLLVG